MKHLSPSEGNKLKAWVNGVNTALKAAETHWREAVRLAHVIKDSGFWKSVTNTWGEFCDLQKWNAHRLNQISNSDAFLREIEEQTGTTVPNSITEFATRELRKSTPKQAAEALERLSKKGLPPTAKNIADEYEPQEPPGLNGEPEKPNEPEIPKDKMGLPLTPEMVDLWNRGEEEIAELVSRLSGPKKIINDAHNDSDPLYHGFDCQGWVNDLNLLIYKLKCHRPYAVCPVCQGRLSKRCNCCKGRGFVGKAYWEGPSVFVEQRAMRDKQIAEASK